MIPSRSFSRYIYSQKRSIGSILNNIQQAPPDKILGLTEYYNKDKNPKKVNLTVGIYKDAWGKVTTFPSVARAQRIIERDSDLNKNLSYLPINGCKSYSENVLNFILNDSCNRGDLVDENRVSFVQTLSGTGAVALASNFIAQFITKNIWLPNLSWPNHDNIFTRNGLKNNYRYSYYDLASGTLSVDKWLSELKEVVPKSSTPHCILLHACCHNPTGLDPTREDWAKIIDTIHELNMIPIIDMAYQGLESGNLIEDAYVIRECLSGRDWRNGIYICQSFAKNMGLYGERIGSLSVITPSKAPSTTKAAIDSQLRQIIRSMYSSPPGYGSRVANLVLADKSLKQQWFSDVESMVNRLKSVRIQMFEKLNWPSIIDFEQQHGMFYFTRFNQKQVDQLKTQFSVYLTNDGRLSLSGINNSNINYVCEALETVSANSSN